MDKNKCSIEQKITRFFKENWNTQSEVAEITGYPTYSIAAFRRAGLIRGQKIGRIMAYPWSQIDRLMERLER